MRLQSFISKSGVTSRRKAADLIENGEVTVDGEIVIEPGFAIDPKINKVCVRGEPVGNPRKIYYAFNKPRNVVTTLDDKHASRKVTDYFRQIYERIYPVGRLDKDTTGLIIMTNDGDFANYVTHPRYECKKYYEALLERALSRDMIKKAKKGMKLEDGANAHAEIRLLGKRKGGFLYEVVLGEGKKREIRQIMKIFGVKLKSLHRTKIGPLEIGSLKSGHFREISLAEIEAFYI